MALTAQPRARHRSHRVIANPRVVLDGAQPTPPVVTPERRKRTLAVVAALLIAAFLTYDLSALNDLREDPITGVDYVPIAAFVAERHKPGETILTALPAPAYLAVNSTDDLVFLSSPIDRKRAQRYTRLTADGRYVDYWTGADSVVDVAGLCNTLLNSPNIWVLVDEGRLLADWAFLGPMADVITGLTFVQYVDPSASQVRRLAPRPARDPFAEAICDAALSGRPLPSRPVPVVQLPS